MTTLLLLSPTMILYIYDSYHEHIEILLYFAFLYVVNCLCGSLWKIFLDKNVRLEIDANSYKATI